MNDDPIDRALTDAFRHRHVPDGARPSLIDVRTRAHRRQRRRGAAMVGAAAVTGVGAIAILANRDPGGGPLTAGQSDAEAATTIACFEVPTTVVPATTTTMPPTTSPAATIAAGDSTSTVMFPIGDPCVPVPAGWRCLGPMASTDEGWTNFEYCEQVAAFDPALTTTFDPSVSTTTTTIVIPDSTVEITGSTVNTIPGNIIPTSTFDPSPEPTALESAVLATTTTSIEVATG